jgi:hypothetical protein
MIERSNPACSNDDDGEFMKPCPDGEYVAWEDFAELLATLECMVLARRDNGDVSKGLEGAEALIARIGAP